MANTDELPVDPDYAIIEEIDEGVTRCETIGRKIYARVTAPSRRQFRLVFRGRPTPERISLQQFYHEIQDDFFTFTFRDYAVAESIYADRIFPVRFTGPPSVAFIGNDQYDIECELMEAPGCALKTEDYPDPDDGHYTATITQSWIVGADLILVYGGYGLSVVGADGYEVTLDGVSLGNAPVTKLDVPLALHRVAILNGYALETVSLEVVK